DLSAADRLPIASRDHLVDAIRDASDEPQDQDPHAFEGAYYDEGAPVGNAEEEFYDDPPRSRGRNGLITAVTLIACAMIGTAGAYGYRTYYSNSSGTNTAAPPVITADTKPSKVVASIDTQTTKSFQDRVAQ